MRMEHGREPRSRRGTAKLGRARGVQRNEDVAVPCASFASANPAPRPRHQHLSPPRLLRVRGRRSQTFHFIVNYKQNLFCQVSTHSFLTLLPSTEREGLNNGLRETGAFLSRGTEPPQFSSTTPQIRTRTPTPSADIAPLLYASASQARTPPPPQLQTLWRSSHLSPPEKVRHRAHVPRYFRKLKVSLYCFPSTEKSLW